MTWGQWCGWVALVAAFVGVTYVSSVVMLAGFAAEDRAHRAPMFEAPPQ